MTKPIRKPELSTLEKESKRKTLFSVSMDKKLVGSVYKINNLLVSHNNFPTYFFKMQKVIGIVFENQKVKLAGNIVNLSLSLCRNCQASGVGASRVQVQQL